MKENTDDIYEFRSDLLDIDINLSYIEKSKIIKDLKKDIGYLEYDYKVYFEMMLTFDYYYVKFIEKLSIAKEKGEFNKKIDIEVASDGRIIKINNWDSNDYIFCVNHLQEEETSWDKKYTLKAIERGFAYNTAEARDKAVNKMKVETKLKNIAEELNDGVAIDWTAINQDKFHLQLDITSYRDESRKLFYKLEQKQNHEHRIIQGTIHCLSPKFLEIAKQEIGEENLINYFK